MGNSFEHKWTAIKCVRYFIQFYLVTFPANDMLRHLRVLYYVSQRNRVCISNSLLLTPLTGSATLVEKLPRRSERPQSMDDTCARV